MEEIPPCPSCGSTRSATCNIEIIEERWNGETIRKTGKGICCMGCLRLAMKAGIFLQEGEPWKEK